MVQKVARRPKKIGTLREKKQSRGEKDFPPRLPEYVGYV
jgi:hypothetical protein